QIRTSPSGASRHLPINGEEQASLPAWKAASPPPPHKWGGATLRSGFIQPLRRLRRHLPINGEEQLRTGPSGGFAAASPYGEDRLEDCFGQARRLFQAWRGHEDDQLVRPGLREGADALPRLLRGLDRARPEPSAPAAF